MLKAEYTTKFEKDLRKVQKQNNDIIEIKKITDKIINEIPLDKKHKEHKLTGNYKGTTECHIKPDLLLLYQIQDNTVVFVRIGSHSELFN
jgi:mRNA interferase YafQ